MTSPRVLVVDDEPANRDMLSRRLERRGYEVVTAASGPEALAACEGATWQAVLLDVQMPGMSGLDVLRVLRSRWTAAELPVLMVTARDASEDVVRALELGASDYITKPVDFPVALARLRTQIALKTAEDRLRVSEERYALAAHGANDGLWDWDLTNDELYLSSRWKCIAGCEEAVGSHPDEWFRRVHSEDLPRLRRDLEAHLSGSTPHFESEHRLRYRDGDYRWVLSRGLAVRADDGRPLRVAGSLTDITVSKVVDPLTGLPNRRLLHDRLDAALAAASDSRCAVLLLDLDGFKLVTDGHGQYFADDLVRAVARRLESTLRASDAIVRGGPSHPQTLARVGGDEFVLVLHSVPDAVAAQRVAERLHRTLARPFNIKGRDIFVSASIGIALSTPGATPDDLLRDADTAVTEARARGRGRAEVFEAGMRAQVLQRLDLDASLQAASERGEFLPYFQPIIDLRSGALVGFEALIRWRRGDGRIVSPAMFVSALEETGLMIPVGRRLVQDVCRQLRQWRRESSAAGPLWVNVNFTSAQFAEPDTLDTLLASISDAGLRPADIVVEITESAALGDLDRAIETLQRFRAAGLRVVLDDFGTGYSSLSCLHELPISGIKLDRSFVSGERRRPEILAAVVTLAEHLGLTVTAEGIETAAQHEHLRTLGCRYAQGYRFARPMPGDAVVALISRQPVWLPDASGEPLPPSAVAVDTPLR